MTTWVYERGHLVAFDDAGGVLVELQADRVFSPLADLLNVCQELSRVLLAGYGHSEQKKGRSPRVTQDPARPSTQPAPA